MSTNRLGTLSAALVGIGWGAAIAINLIFWLPQHLDPSFWDNGEQFLSFVRDNTLTWRAFHIGATSGLMALLFLIGLLANLDENDPRRMAFTLVGAIGAFAALLASLIDHLGTPVLARLAAGNSLIVLQIWQFVEPWRDAGLKTVSYWFLGIWALWIGGRWLAQSTRRLGRFSQVMGIALLLLALIESMVPQPLIYTLGETGVGAAVFLLLPIWGFWAARWFWERELADFAAND
ncbi:MAG: hypothetical protein R3E31_05355 [Chloroflexota bacterium]